MLLWVGILLQSDWSRARESWKREAGVGPAWHMIYGCTWACIIVDSSSRVINYLLWSVVIVSSVIALWIIKKRKPQNWHLRAIPHGREWCFIKSSLHCFSDCSLTLSITLYLLQSAGTTQHACLVELKFIPNLLLCSACPVLISSIWLAQNLKNKLCASYASLLS